MDVGNVFLDCAVVSVSKQDGDYIVWMSGYPVADFAEVGGDGASVEDLAGCVTEMGRAVVAEVHLALEETDSVVQLVCDS